MIFLIPTPSFVAYPDTSDCSTLLTYIGTVITELENTQNRLNEASTDPDQALSLIKEKVSTLLGDARQIQSNLKTIETSAKSKSSINNMYTRESEGILLDGFPSNMA